MRENGSENLRGDHRGPVHQDQERKKLCDEEWVDVRHVELISSGSICRWPFSNGYELRHATAK
jgi:hypothetical protein